LDPEQLIRQEENERNDFRRFSKEC
jgi:hypothetical protein